MCSTGAHFVVGVGSKSIIVTVAKSLGGDTEYMYNTRLVDSPVELPASSASCAVDAGCCVNVSP